MNRKSAFTLVELLVVIAIIGILLGMLLPSVQQVREAARRIQCSNRQRQLGLALHMYHDTRGKLPAGWIATDSDGEPGWGWGAVLLPYIEQGNLYDQIDLTIPVDDEASEDVRRTVVDTFICPSDPADRILDLDFLANHDGHGHGDGGHDHDEEIMVAKGNFSGVFGTFEIEDNPGAGDGVFFENSQVQLRDVFDGLSNTIFVGERRADIGTVTWVGVSPGVEEPFARIVGSADHPPNHHDGHFEDFSSSHPGGANFVRGDGSVNFISDTIEEDIFRALATRDAADLTGGF